METIIWKDGTTSTINSFDAYQRQYKQIDENGNWQHYMKFNDCEFIWKANC